MGATIERLPSFTHFVVGLLGAYDDDEGGDDACEFLSWEEARAHAEQEGYTCVLGVTWDATQLLALDGRAAGQPIERRRP